MPVAETFIIALFVLALALMSIFLAATFHPFLPIAETFIIALFVLALALGARGVRDVMTALIGAVMLMSVFLAATFHTSLVEFANSDSPLGWAVILPPVMTFCLALIGLVCVPVAAISSYVHAKARGLLASEHAIRGAGYSASFLLPWLYLMARMQGITVPRTVAIVTYVLLYVCWFNLIGSYLAIILKDSIPFHSYGLEGVHLGLGSFVWLAAAGVNFFAWTLSLLRLLRADKGVRENVDRPTGGTVLKGAYLHPFVELLVWLMAIPILALITLPITLDARPDIS